MGRLTVLRPGIQTQIQDTGRPGLAFYGIPCGGPLDRTSGLLGNAILKQPQNCPIIECHYTAPKLRFDTAATICLTGADFGWKVNSTFVALNQTIRVNAGDRLSGGSGTDGCRAYLSIRGHIQTTQSYGSAACYELAGFGGNGGRVLAAGDQLRWREATGAPEHIELAFDGRPSGGILAYRGPEYDWLTKKSRATVRECEFCVSPDSNRMGIRLNGPPLHTGDQRMTASVPMLPGFVQLTPSGDCIVAHRDGQTTGGYPRILWMPQASLNRLSQMLPGQKFVLRCESDSGEKSS